MIGRTNTRDRKFTGNGKKGEPSKNNINNGQVPNNTHRGVTREKGNLIVPAKKEQFQGGMDGMKEMA